MLMVVIVDGSYLYLYLCTMSVILGLIRSSNFSTLYLLKSSCVSSNLLTFANILIILSVL